MATTERTDDYQPLAGLSPRLQYLALAVALFACCFCGILAFNYTELVREIHADLRTESIHVKRIIVQSQPDGVSALIAPNTFLFRDGRAERLRLTDNAISLSGKDGAGFAVVCNYRAQLSLTSADLTNRLVMDVWEGGPTLSMSNRKRATQLELGFRDKESPSIRWWAPDGSEHSVLPVNTPLVGLK